MKKFLIPLIIFIFSYSNGNAENNLGKIIQIIGDTDITSLSFGRKFIPKTGVSITRDYRIRTGKRSFLQILLNNGTKLFIRELSVLNILNIKSEENEPPTKIRVLTGKIRVIVKRNFKSRTLILRTPTALIGVSGTDFGIITSKDETKVVVFEGNVEIASYNREIIKSYKLKGKEESSIKLNKPPEEPSILPSEIISSWFDYYDVIDKKRIIIRGKIEEGIIDKLLRKKKFNK